MTDPGSLDTPRRVVRGTVAFVAAAVLLRAAPFLLLPLFARVLTPAEFGQIGVVVTLATALGTVLSFGLETAVFRGYIERRDDPQRAARFINTVAGFAVVAPFLLALVTAALIGPTLADFFGVPVEALMIGFVGTACNVSATIAPLALLRAQERLRSYLALTWMQVGVSAGLSIGFVAIARWGVVGWMAASALTAAVLLGRGLLILGHRWAAEFDPGALRAALRFGLPLVPHTLAHWGLAASDRAILGAFVAANVVGAYYVGFLITLPVNLVAIALSQATQPLFAEAAASSERQAELGRIVTMQAVLVVLVGATVASLGPPAAELLLPPTYAATSAFIPWLAAGACFFALYLIPMNAVAVMAGQTRHVWVVTVAAAAMNIGLNLALVPRFGAQAAAVNTAVGYGVLLVGLMVYTRRVSHATIPLEPGRIGTGVLLVGIAYAIGALFAPESPALALVMRGGLLVAAAGLLVTVGPLGREARLALRVLRPLDGGIRQ